MISYRFSISNLYHLVLVVGVWLLKKLKIFENLSGFQCSATIDAPSDLHLEVGEDVPFQPSTVVVTGVDKVDLPTVYKSVGDGIVYNEVRDKTAEVEESEVEESEVGVEESDIDAGEGDDNGMVALKTVNKRKKLPLFFP